VDEEKRAQRLADWLEATPGTEPPEDLDPEVLGAVYALAPHRAPPPRVGIDDILAGVTTGPFAAPTMDNVVEFPRRPVAAETAPGGGEVVPLRPLPSADDTLAPGHATRAPSAEAQVGRRAPAPRKPSRWWMGPAFGVGLAAAAAAAIVLPIAGNLASRQIAGNEEARLEAAPVPASPAGAPAPQAAPPADEGADLRADAPAEFAAAEQDGNGLSGGRTSAGGGGAAAPTVPKSAGPMAGAPSPAPLADAAPPPPPAAAPPPPPAAPGKESQAIAELAEQPAAAPGGWLGSKEDAKDMREKKGEAAPVQQAATEAAPAGGAAASTGAVTAARADKSSARSSTAAPRAKAPSASAPAAAPVAVAADEAAPQEERARRYIPEASRDDDERAESEGDAAPVSKASSTSSAANVVTSARSAATPLDYNPSWYSGDPSIAAGFDALRAQEAAGQWEAAAAGWKALTGHARADVAQDAALRAGKALRTLGRTTDALAIVDTGLRRSALNTPFRAALLALRGELLLALGRAADAERAFEEAAGLNNRR
jgi:hypothetical protein